MLKTIWKWLFYHSKVVREFAIGRQILKSSDNSFDCVDLQGRFIFTNAVKCERYGKNLTGLRYEDVFDPEQAAYARNEDLIISEGGIIPEKIEKISRDGVDAWVSVKKIPFRDIEGNIVGIIHRSKDVTEQENLRIERDRFQKVAFAFFGDAAHKMKSPMFTANGMLSRIVRGKYGAITNQSVLEALKNVLRQYQTIEHRAEHSIQHTAAIISGHRENGRSRKLVDVGGEINAIIRELEGYMDEHGASIDATMGLIPPEEVFLLVDPNLFYGVVENLLRNGIKYGSLAEDGKTRRENVTISYGSWMSEDHTTLYVNVWDDGHGFPEQQFADLCKPFERADATSEAVEGSGIGLSTVRDFMELMGGKLAYERTEEGHPNFILAFPYNKQEVQQAMCEAQS